MKKSYLQPETEILNLQGVKNVMLGTSDTPADPGAGMDVKEDNAWDIWGNNDAE